MTLHMCKDIGRTLEENKEPHSHISLQALLLSEIDEIACQNQNKKE